jgi:hypothetical protein
MKQQNTPRLPEGIAMNGALTLLGMSVYAVVDAKGKRKLFNVFIILGFVGLGLLIGWGLGAWGSNRCARRDTTRNASRCRQRTWLRAAQPDESEISEWLSGLTLQ